MSGRPQAMLLAKQRADNFLRGHPEPFLSSTNTGYEFNENFSPLVTKEVTGASALQKVEQPRRRLYNFFQGGGILTTTEYPCDLDTTSLAWTINASPDASAIQSVMDEMLQYINENGIIQVYFDKTRPRVDPIVCINVLSLFFANGRGSELAGTLEFAYNSLISRSYLHGTRYYQSPEAFLYFATRFVLLSKDPKIESTWKPLIRNHIVELLGTTGDPLALAMRIIICRQLGVGASHSRDVEMLLQLQDCDGGWSNGWIYKYGKSGILIQNRRLTTAFARRALDPGPFRMTTVTRSLIMLLQASVLANIFQSFEKMAKIIVRVSFRLRYFICTF